MRHSLMKCWAILLVPCTAAVCSAQFAASVATHIAPLPSARFPASWYPPDSDVVYTGPPQLGAPYSAVLITTEHLFNQATGEDKRVSQSTFQARDGFGRKRDEVEMPRPEEHGATVLAHEVSVNDPVSHCSFRWMEPLVPPARALAIVSCLSRTLHYTGTDPFSEIVTATQQTQTSSDTMDKAEPLGERTFGDLKASGVKRTRTVTRNGEVERLVTELWYSPELKGMLLFKEVHDPSSKELVSQIPDFELTRIQRGEPDATLFYPPAGYAIESGH